jgi:hypothetical protein
MTDILHEWQNFYFMVGGASATLIGLMFVAVSIGSHLVNEEQMNNVRTYVSPTLYHFVHVLVFACIMLVPVHSQLTLALAIAVIHVLGLRQIIAVFRRMSQQGYAENTRDKHWLWHVTLPALSYGLAVALSYGLFYRADLISGLALVAIVLLICAIRNTWVLVIWIAQQNSR